MFPQEIYAQSRTTAALITFGKNIILDGNEIHKNVKSFVQKLNYFIEWAVFAKMLDKKEVNFIQIPKKNQGKIHLSL